MDIEIIRAFGDEYQNIIKHAALVHTAEVLTKVTKSIRAVPAPRINLPVPKVG